MAERETSQAAQSAAGGAVRDLPYLLAGTVVCLKSGGPPMTVTSINNQCDELISVEWFAGEELRRDAFDLANLFVMDFELTGSGIEDMAEIVRN